MAEDPNSEPAWVTTDSGTGAGVTNQSVSASGGGLDQSAATTTAAASTGAPSAQEVDETDLPKMILVMRLANMGASVALIVCAVSWNFGIVK